MSSEYTVLACQKLEVAFKEALSKINGSISDFSDYFPTASGVDGVYSKQKNEDGRTQSFWTGMLWLAYEFTGEDIYSKTAEGLLPSFANRVDNMLGMGDRDIGFVFTLSMVAGYKITGERLGAGTKQDRFDSSAWLRGQAWGVTGPAFAYSHCKDDSIMKNNCSIVDYYINNHPDDYVAYWDLSFTNGDKPRDSPATSIAVCGLLITKYKIFGVLY